eukprot:422911-Pelagomonas_calceolata.AAC.1
MKLRKSLSCSRGKLVRVWWVSRNTQPQGTSFIMSVFFPMARLVEGMGSIDSPTHTQEDCVESDLCTL